MTLRLLAEVAWLPLGLAVAYGVWRSLEREGAGRAGQVLGTAIAFVALAWLPVAAIDLAARTRHDARLTPTAVENAGAINSKGLVHAIKRLRTTIPEGDTYQLDAYSSRVSFWAYTSLLPRIAVGPGAGADWRIVWHRHPGGAPAGRSNRAGPGRLGRARVMIAHLLALALANLCFLAAGAGIGRALGLWRAPRDLPGAWRRVYLSASRRRGSSRLGRSSPASSWPLAGRRRLRGAGSVGSVPVRRAGLTLPAAPHRRPARVVVALQAAVGLIVVLLLIDAAYRPLAEWDAWAMWTMKAKAITLLGGLDAGVFAGVPYHHLHLDYPLLLPAVEAMGFRFMGSIDTQVIHLQAALLMAALLVSLPRLLADRVPVVVAWASALLIGVAPSLVDQASAGLADAPLAVFFAMAAVFGWRWIADGTPRDARPLGALRSRRARDEARGNAVRGGPLPRHDPRAPGRGTAARRRRRGRCRAGDRPPVAAVAPRERRRHLERRDPVRQGHRPGLPRGPARADPDRVPGRSSGTRSSRARGSSSCRRPRSRWSSPPAAASGGRPCSSPPWRASCW